MDLFNNPGTKIKNVVSIASIVFLVFIILTSIFLMFDIGDFEGFIIGIVYAAFMLFFAWVFLLVVSAFGDIAEKLTEQTEIQNEMLYRMKEIESKLRETENQ